MHPEAMGWAFRFASVDPVRVLDVGGRDINGSPRSLFPHAAPYVAVDLYPGPGVDVVADFVEWTPPHEFDVALCLEVFEHNADWERIIAGMFAALAPGGRLVVTCAGPGRHPHSAVDGGAVRSDEWYSNVSSGELGAVLALAGFVDVEVESLGFDTRGAAVKPS